MPSVTFIPAKPHFHVKRDVFVQIVDSIPPGKLTTPEAIIAFLSDLYGEECISIPDFAYTRIDEALAGVEHNWWRLVSPPLCVALYEKEIIEWNTSKKQAE